MVSELMPDDDLDFELLDPEEWTGKPFGTEPIEPHTSPFTWDIAE